MDAKAKRELEEIIRELNAITKELDSIAYGIGSDFKGIGSAKCAQGVRSLSEKYRYVKNELEDI